MTTSDNSSAVEFPKAGAPPVTEANAAFAVYAGTNKFHTERCPTCNREPWVNPTTPDGNEWKGKFFLFRDHLSAVEYKISGMCQECQDKVFKEPEPHDPELQ